LLVLLLLLLLFLLLHLPSFIHILLMVQCSSCTKKVFVETDSRQTLQFWEDLAPS